MLLNKIFIFTCGIFFAFGAQADAWTGHDKTQHAAVGALIGAAVTATTDDPLKGCVVAAAVGAAKEFYDATKPQTHTSSFKDFAVTAAFGCASSYATGWLITPKEIRYTFLF